MRHNLYNMGFMLSCGWVVAHAEMPDSGFLCLITLIKGEETVKSRLDVEKQWFIDPVPAGVNEQAPDIVGVVVSRLMRANGKAEQRRQLLNVLAAQLDRYIDLHVRLDAAMKSPDTDDPEEQGFNRGFNYLGGVLHTVLYQAIQQTRTLHETVQNDTNGDDVEYYIGGEQAILMQAIVKELTDGLDGAINRPKEQ